MTDTVKHEPRYSGQISLGNILAGIASVTVILGGLLAWGISYGTLSNAVAQSANAIVMLSARIDQRDMDNSTRDKLLAGMQTDISYLRRWVEGEKRAEAALK